MFYRVKNNTLLDFADTKYLDECLYTDIITQVELTKDPNKVIVQDNVIVLNPNYETEKQSQEEQRLSMLSLTAADVERGIYKATGKDFDDVIAYVQSLCDSSAEPQNDEGVTLNDSEVSQGLNIDIKALKIELKANNFYRGNSYVDVVGSLLGFTKDQLDEFFETGDWQCLRKEVL